MERTFILTFCCCILKTAYWTFTLHRCSLNSKWICGRLSEPIHNCFQKGCRYFLFTRLFLNRVKYNVLCNDTVPKLLRYRLPFNVDTSTIQYLNKRQNRSLGRFWNMQRIKLCLAEQCCPKGNYSKVNRYLFLVPIFGLNFNRDIRDGAFPVDI